jgi:hypothetical protein
MVCYARPASRLAALLIVALLVFGHPVGHFLDTAAILVAALAVVPPAARPSPQRWFSPPSPRPGTGGPRRAAA